MSHVSIRNLTKGFADGLALQDFSLDIRSGEFLILVGPSGCGKSTLLSLIAGLDKADSGEILVDGVPVSGPHPERSLVFQDGALFPWLTVRKNVEFGLLQQGLPKKEREDRARNALDRVGLLNFEHHRVHELSGGMRQRVAIARSLVLRPRILLMDEPFAALDDSTREELHAELQDLWHEHGTTIVFVTHNVREAVTLGDRVVALTARPGRTQAVHDIGILRPRSIDDIDVSQTALGISRTLKTSPFQAHELHQTHPVLCLSPLGLGDSC